MNYIGSKYSLLDFLDESISSVVDQNCKTFCDLFAGTGAVGSHFKKKGYSVIANDIQYYSYVLNRHYLGNHTELPFDGLNVEIPALHTIDIEKRAAVVCDYLNDLPGVQGFIFHNYCLGGTIDSAEKRQYFSDENGMRCDAIRQKIEGWKTSEQVTEDEYYFLLSSLVESIDSYANTASVYGAFLKKIKKTAQKKMVLKPAELIVNDQEHTIYNSDINELIDKIEGDILYLDPPYNHRQYATNYHILETITRYDNPEIHGKTGLRDYDQQKSLYCSKKHVQETFKNLILKANAKYIFLSYNNEGLLSPEYIKEILSLRGAYGYFKKEYARFKADKQENRNYSADKTTEYLHYVVCK